jgi:hypothetical protein
MNKERPSYNLFLILLLQFAFLLLKVKGYIDWGWLWIFSPLWLYVISVFLVSVVVTLALFFSIRSKIKQDIKTELAKQKTDKQLELPFGE